LPVALALDQNPVLVPVRQEVGAERGRVHAERVGVRLVERATGERLGLTQIDFDVPAQRELLPVRRDELPAVAVEAPESRAKARVGTFLGRVEPERARHVQPVQRPVVERDEREHALRGHGQCHGLVVADQPECVEERQPGTGHRHTDAARCAVHIVPSKGKAEHRPRGRSSSRSDEQSLRLVTDISPR